MHIFAQWNFRPIIGGVENKEKENSRCLLNLAYRQSWLVQEPALRLQLLHKQVLDVSSASTQKEHLKYLELEGLTEIRSAWQLQKVIKSFGSPSICRVGLSSLLLVEQTWIRASKSDPFRSIREAELLVHCVYEICDIFECLTGRQILQAVHRQVTET